MNKRKALGKGLDALLPTARSKSGDGLTHIPLEKLRPNSFQPRMRFEGQSLDDLAASIAKNGLLQPVVVRPKGDGYELIAGERRWRASQRAGLSTVPALVQTVSDQEMVQLALVENIQRDDLTAIEEAHAYQVLVEDFGLTQEEVAAQVARSRPAVANTLRLLQLPKKLQKMVLTGELSMGHARALLALKRSDQMQLSQDILKKGLSVRQTEKKAQALVNPPPPKATQRKDPNLREAEERLEERWRTKVEIRPKGKSPAGQVLIHYHDDEDLQRLYNLLMGEETPD